VVKKTLKNEGFRMETAQKARAEAVMERMTAQVGGRWTWSDTLRYLIEQGLRYDAATNGAQRPGGTGASSAFAGAVATVDVMGFNPTPERLEMNEAAKRAGEAGWPVVRVATDDMRPAFSRGDLVSVEPATTAKNRDVVFAVYDDVVFMRELRCDEEMTRAVLMPRDTESAEPIPVTDFSAFRILGVVREVVYNSAPDGRRRATS
jgi:hypothetical protein